MKSYTYQTREEYLQAQVERSQHKFGYCKVFFWDVLRYRTLIQMDITRRTGRTDLKPINSILCLGVRYGAEVDLFRTAFFGALAGLKPVQRWLNRKDHNTDAQRKIRLARRAGLGAGRRSDGRVLGVELNPDAAREDIHIGSFDELPADWSGKFDLIYSNSIDHSQDLERTVAEWKRVCKPGGYVIVAFTIDKDVSPNDPLGGLTFERMNAAWGERFVFATQTMNRTGYSEVCYRIEG